MPLPSYVLSSDTFSTWLAATNNTLSYLIDANNFILVAQNATPLAATGNAAVDGTLSVSRLNVNASANLAGTNANVSANAAFTGANFTVSSNGSFTGTTFGVSANATFSGASVNVSSGTLRVGGAANLQSTLGVAGVVTFSANADVLGTLTANGAYFPGTGTVLSNATVLLNNTVTANAVTTFTKNASVLGVFSTNATTILGGPLSFGNNFYVYSTISGGAAVNDFANNVTGASNVVVYSVASTGSAGTLGGFHNPDPTTYRSLVLFNSGTFDIVLSHNGSSSIANNRFECPAGIDFTLPTGGSVTLTYDANTAVRHWRVNGATTTNASTLSSGTIAYSVLPSSLVNATSGVANSSVFLSTNTVTTNTTVLSVSNSTSNVIVSPAHVYTGNSTWFLQANSTLITSANAMGNTVIGPTQVSLVGATQSAVHTYADSKWLSPAASSNVTITGSGITSIVGGNTGQLYGNTFTGSSNNATNFAGQAQSYYLNATNINTGTLAAARYVSANSTANGGVDTTTQTFAGSKTFANNLSTGAIFYSREQVEDLTINAVAGGANGQMTHLVSTATKVYYTANATTDFAPEASGVTAALSVGQQMMFNVLVTQGAAAKNVNSTLIVDGDFVTTKGGSMKWKDGSTPAGNASCVEQYSYRIIRTGTNAASGIYTVLAEKVKFA